MTDTSVLGPRRYKVKADAFYVRHADGVWLRNNTGSFSIRGAGSYQLVESLFRQLDGRRTVDEVCAGLAEAAHPPAARLIDALLRNGFIKEIDYPVEDVPDWMRERYSTHLLFLEHHADRPVARLHRVREREVACLGTGVALRALLGALGEFGLARLLIVTGAADAVDVTDLIAEATAGDPEVSWRVHTVDDPADLAAAAELPEVCQAAQVLIATDTVGGEAIAQVQCRLRESGRTVGILGRCGDYVIAAPPVAEAEWCWDCVRREVVTAARVSAEGLGPAVAPATVAALHLARHVFAALAGVTLPDAGTLVSVEPVAPDARTHTARRHPLCHRHGPAPRPTIVTVDRGVVIGDRPVAGQVAPRADLVRPDVPASEDRADLVAVSDRIVVVTTRWIDRVMGPLLSLGEGPHEQLPLAASSCLVPDPAGAGAAPATRLFVCRAISPREARNQVVLFALEWLADRVAHLGGQIGVNGAGSGADPVTAADVGAGLVFGAGWSVAEALYRARLAASSIPPPDRKPPDREPPDRVPPDRDWADPVGSAAQGPIRSFLADTLAAAGRPWCASVLVPLPTGFVQARIGMADGPVAVGLGVDDDHAVDNALLAAVAATLPGRSGETVVPAHLAPPARTWSDAVALVTKRADETPAIDLSDLLPFVGRDAHVIAVRRGSR